MFSDIFSKIISKEKKRVLKKLQKTKEPLTNTYTIRVAASLGFPSFAGFTLSQIFALLIAYCRNNSVLL